MEKSAYGPLSFNTVKVSSPNSLSSPATAMDITLTSYPEGKHTLPQGASQFLCLALQEERLFLY